MSALTSPDRRTEYVGIVPVVVAELKFRDVQREIFGADFMERADHAALTSDQKPSMVCVWTAPTTY